VLDEVGRGTSTYDGISLAWAIAEELHNVVGAKTLFATHFHELTQLETDEAIQAHGGALKNFSMAVKEQGNSVIFLRQVIPGGAEKSFGIHVARLAGLPERVVSRAEEMLTKLEESRSTTDDRPQTTADRLQMISHAQSSVIGDQQDAVLREERAEYDARIDLWRGILQQLIAIDIANMTPLQALNVLNEMQMVIKEPGGHVVE